MQENEVPKVLENWESDIWWLICPPGPTIQYSNGILFTPTDIF